MEAFVFRTYHLLTGLSPAPVPLKHIPPSTHIHHKLTFPLSLTLQWPGNEVTYNHVPWVGILIPNTSGCDLTWRRGLYRGNQVEMKSQGWGQRMTSVLVKRGNWDTNLHGGKMMRHTEKMATYKTRRQAWDKPSLTALKGTNLWPWTCSLHTVREYMSVVCGTLLPQP